MISSTKTHKCFVDNLKRGQIEERRRGNRRNKKRN
jgi:hypothetical protein